MKLEKRVTVNGNDCKIVSESVVLDLTAPGRAVFVIQADQISTGGLLQFHFGTNGKIELWFSGYIENARKIDGKQIRITVREYSALLARRWTMSQRYTTARRVLSELSGRTGIGFRMGSGSVKWADTPIPYFFNIGSGYGILELIGKHLQIPDFVWQNQPDGTIFIGSGSELAGAGSVLGIPTRFFTNLTGSGADCPCLPALRPGRRIKIGNLDPVRIETITLTGETMRLGFQC